MPRHMPAASRIDNNSQAATCRSMREDNTDAMGVSVQVQHDMRMPKEVVISMLICRE